MKYYRVSFHMTSRDLKDPFDNQTFTMSETALARLRDNMMNLGTPGHDCTYAFYGERWSYVINLHQVKFITFLDAEEAKEARESLKGVWGIWDL